jgi:transketolase
VNTVEQEAEIRMMARQILLAAHNGREGHIPSALSILDILYSIFSSKNLKIGESDDFILSKGHASLAYYAILNLKSSIPSDWVDTFAKFESPYGGHPHTLKIAEVTASTGSLGHGLPLGTGMALARQIRSDQGRTIVLLGDGEINEGTTWESSLFAAHHGLSNLMAIVDYNESGNRAINLGDICSKFGSLGWQVFSAEGHDVSQLKELISRQHSSKPVAIIANTIKGFRIKEMENNPAWHHTRIDDSTLASMMKELS